MKISYWMDYNCPYCYIGINRLNMAIKKMKLNDVKLDVHSFELDPNAPRACDTTTLERFMEKYGLSNSDAKKEIDKITRWAVDDGLAMNYENVKFTNSRDAHRLTKLAIESNDQEIIKQLQNSLFENYFSKNRNLCDKSLLLEIGVNVGLKKESVTDVLNSDRFEREVELDEQVAKDTGINGVPYFIFNNRHVLPGILPLEEFINVLRKIKFEEDIARELEKGK
ncbi:MAG: hypothetical protein BZ138_01320 [Methanosphaera sp. rholeuAM270]|nr:MAG: hypothetical protein BZ138_01320 [Methanosphaera sp. rholeuAM270]